VSYNGRPVIDTDTHIREYVELDRTYRDYIDPEYREPYEGLSAAVAKRREAGLPTALFMNPMAVIEPASEARPLGVHDTYGLDRLPRPGTGPQQSTVEVNWDPQLRLADMDRAQVDVSVQFPSHSPSFCTLRDVGFERALHRAYHRFMTNFCAESEGRLRWVFTTTMRDVPASIEELTYWAEHDSNLVGLQVSPSCPDGTLLDNPALHPLYQRAQDLDLPLMVHGGVLRPPYTAGATELNNSGFILRAVYQPWAGMTAMSALIGGGVFDLFPQLRVGIFETSAGWVPWLVERLDESYRPSSGLTPNLARKPSEVVAEGRLFHAVESDEHYLKHCVDALGDEMWVFATDYPHIGSPWPEGVPNIAQRPELSESTKQKILSANALRMCPRLAD
jgi:hypothetical protein